MYEALCILGFIDYQYDYYLLILFVYTHGYLLLNTYSTFLKFTADYDLLSEFYYLSFD